MLFIRVSDATEICAGDNKTVVFSEEKRKGNIVRKFVLDRETNEINFFKDELVSKMIPKASLNILDEHPIKIIITQSGNFLIFQDLDCRVNFLTQNSDTGKIEKLKFDDIIAEDDSILCNDGDDDWYLDDVTQTFMIFKESNLDDELNDMELEDQELVRKITDGLFDEENGDMELSNYILSSENGGIIISNIMVI